MKRARADLAAKGLVGQENIGVLNTDALEALGNTAQNTDITNTGV